MEFSMLGDSTFSADISICHGTRRKLEDELGELDNDVRKEKKLKQDDTDIANNEHMGVYLRVRPFTEKEKSNQENQGCMDIENQHLLVAHAPVGSNTYKNSQHGCGKQTHRFTFTRIFDEMTAQKDFFDHTVLDKVKDFIEGQNSLIFTYGVTNSGKTFTIQGHAKDGGILPRSLDVLFNSIGERQMDSPAFKPSMFSDVVCQSPAEQELEQHVKQRVLEMAVIDEESDVTVSSMVGDSDSSRLTIGSRMSEDSLNVDSGHASEQTESSDKSGVDLLFKEAEDRVREDAAVHVASGEQSKFLVWVSFIEIYNEYIYDLLEPIPKKKTARRATVTLREDKNGIPYVKGVKQIQVSTADEAYKILVIGKQNLQMACTKLNHNSSRSHCIFSIKLVRITENHSARVNMLSFCDLAGAERYSKTQSAGDRIKEAGNINTSLLSLGRCIKILRHNQVNKDHTQLVPFRDSKLTRIFQSSLTGKGKASMIVNINQCASTFDETLHALKYSAIAKQVVIVQEPPKEPEKTMPPPTSSRYVSMLLAQAQADPKGPRPTIAFGTPGTLARVLQEEEEDEAPTPKAVSDDDQENKFMEIIETLKTELIKERCEKNMLEWNIRNEVLLEVQEQLQDQEQHFEERMREMRERLEDRADSKVNLLLQSMKKKKRQREETDEDELNQTELLKSAVEAKDSQIEILEDRVKDLEEGLRNAGEEAHKTPPNMHTAPRTPSTESDHMAVIQQLQDKLMDVKSQLSEKEGERAEMEEMLREAAETFEQKAAEIEKLEKDLQAYSTKSIDQESRLKELTQLLEESNENKAEAVSQCCSLDRKVASLTAQLEAANSKDCSSCHEQISHLGKVDSKLADAEADIDEIKSHFIRIQKEVSGIPDEPEELRQKIQALEQEVSELRNPVKEEVKEEIKTEIKEENQNDNNEAQVVSLNVQLKEDLSSVEKTKKECEIKLAQTKEAKLELQGKVDKLQEVIDEHQTALRDHETFVAELNKQLKDAKANLEVMTVNHSETTAKYNELNEKIKKEEDENFKIQERLAVLEEERDQLVADVEAKEKRLQDNGRRSLQLENKVDALEESLQQANSALREATLDAANVKEKLSELMKSKDSIEKEHNECKSQIDNLQEQLEDYILRVNEQVEEIGELKEKFQAEEKKTAVLQTKSVEAESKLVEQEGELKNLHNKVTDLEARLKAERKQQKSAGNELDELLQSKAITIEELNTDVSQLKKKLHWKENEMKLSKDQIEVLEKKLEEMTKAHDKIEALNLKLADARAQVLELESEKVDIETLPSKEKDTSANEIESLQGQIRQMKNEVSEAQYSAQMNSRTLRREKSQIEKRLKETEEELNEVKTNMLRLQSDLASEKIAKKATSMEEEDRESRDDLTKRLEEQTKKAKRLEDIVQDLEDCFKCAKSSQQAAEDTLESYKKKCRTLENELGFKEDRLQSMEGRLSELDLKTRDIENKQEEIDKLNDSVCDLEHKCKEYRSGMDALEARLSYIGLLEEKNESILSELDEHDRKVQELNMMLEEAAKRIGNLEQELVAANEELTKGETATKELQESLSAKNNNITELETKVSELSAEIENFNETAQEKSKDVIEMKTRKETVESELKLTLASQREAESKYESRIEELETKIREYSNSSTELEKSQAEYEEKRKECLQKESTIKDLKSQMEKLENAAKEQNTVLQDKLLEMEKLHQMVDQRNIELQKVKADLESLQSEKSNVNSLLTSHESTVESFKEQVSSLKDEVQSLSQKAQEREKELRKQLADASSRQEEQNKNCNTLEDRLREAREAAEKQDEVIKENREVISKLREDLRSVRKDVFAAQDERSVAQQHLSTEKVALDSKIRQLQEEVDNKEVTLSELMVKIETDYKNFETSMEDARAKEAVLGQLKQALKDQDAAIELQEQALKRKEDEIILFQTEHEEIVEKYNSLLKETSSHSTSVHDLTRQLQKLRGEKKEAERAAASAEDEAREARAAVGRSEKEKTQFKRDMDDTNRELREMEKILSDARREVEQLKHRLAEMRPTKSTDAHPNHDEEKLNLLKTKFVALEFTNTQLEDKIRELQKEIVEAEESKKAELDCWRENRDKLVSQLEKILKQKEAQINEMKKASANTPKTDHELQNRLDKLEMDLRDKDAIIAELCANLPTADVQNSRTRRATRSGADETAPALRKENQELRKQFEADRQSHSRDMARLVKAKDQIINDLRQTNLTLQSRFPGGSQSHALSVVPEVRMEEEAEDLEHRTELSPRKGTVRRSTRRPRKRKSSEEEGEKTKTPRRKQQRKQEAQLQVSFDENDQDLDSNKNEEMEEVEGLLVDTPAKRVALTDTLNTTALAKFISPSMRPKEKLETPQSKSRRKVKLRAPMAEPFAESPPLSPAPTPSKDASHEIVTRQLRSRRKCTNV